MSGKRDTSILHYFKWEKDDSNMLRAAFTKEDFVNYENIGRVFLAIHEYAFEGTTPAYLTSETEPIFRMLQVKVDNSKRAYKDTSDKRAAAGKVGGETKSANRSVEENRGWTPPNKTEFKNLCRGVLRDYGRPSNWNFELQLQDDQKADLYESLKEKNWSYSNGEIVTSEMLKGVILYAAARNTGQAECFILDIFKKLADIKEDRNGNKVPTVEDIASAIERIHYGEKRKKKWYTTDDDGDIDNSFDTLDELLVDYYDLPVSDQQEDNDTAPKNDVSQEQQKENTETSDVPFQWGSKTQQM